jgi:gas vesicle protein
MKDSGKTLRTGALGVLIGAAAGFALGVLFAPEEGKKLRRKLAYQLENLGSTVSDLIDRAVSEPETSEARREADAIVRDANEKASVIRNDIDALLDEIRHKPS